MKLEWRDRRLWLGTLMLLLIAGPLAFAYYGTTTGPPAPTPTPYPPPAVEGLWRIEGAVIDASNKPIEGVCLAIGPLGCRATSPKSKASRHRPRRSCSRQKASPRRSISRRRS